MNYTAELIRKPLSNNPLTDQQDFQQTAYKWKVTINGIEFDFYMGSALNREPTLDDVLECLLIDAETLEMSFPDWCAEFGYSTDSISALRIYIRSRHNARKLLQTDIDLDAIRERLQDR